MVSTQQPQSLESIAVALNDATEERNTLLSQRDKAQLSLQRAKARLSAGVGSSVDEVRTIETAFVDLKQRLSAAENTVLTLVMQLVQAEAQVATERKEQLSDAPANVQVERDRQLAGMGKSVSKLS